MLMLSYSSLKGLNPFDLNQLYLYWRRQDLLELIHKRRKKSSTIFCSQFRQEGWYEKFADETVADAILDRIVNDAYKVNIESIDPKSDLSMREVYGLDKALSE